MPGALRPPQYLPARGSGSYWGVGVASDLDAAMGWLVTQQQHTIWREVRQIPELGWLPNTHLVAELPGANDLGSIAAAINNVKLYIARFVARKCIWTDNR